MSQKPSQLGRVVGISGEAVRPSARVEASPAGDGNERSGTKGAAKSNGLMELACERQNCLATL
jgi:hypothetical protein